VINPYVETPEGLAELLLDAERFHHERGWDNTPTTVYVVGPRALTGGRFGLNLTVLREAPVAHLLVTEGWMRTFASRAHCDAEPRRFADILDSRECRFAIAVTGDAVLRLQRVRGQAPEWVDETVGGTLVASLRAVHQATCELYPSVRSGH